MNDALVYGLNATHERLLMCLNDVTDDEARRSPAEDLAPIIWQVGHIAFYDHEFAKRVDAAASAPAGFAELFKAGTGRSPADYPAFTVVKSGGEAGQRALLAIAERVDASTPVDSPRYRTVGEMLTFMVYHRGYHVGKITTLRAMLKKTRLFG